jgi:CDGSH-type Zn-finger protein
MREEMKITITRNGPYVVAGSVPLATELIVCDPEGIPVTWAPGEKYPRQEKYSLCRCGESGTMPFCDSTHKEVGFKDTVPAENKPYFEDPDFIEGPGILLYDVPSLCSRGEFCYRGGKIWRLAATLSDPKSVATVIENACDCPSGRLVAADKETGEAIEPELEPSISLIEMPAVKISGPIWVKGGIPIKSIEGWLYEVRNRVTLCRCGKSANMPFCDGAHFSLEFNDGSKSVS